MSCIANWYMAQWGGIPRLREEPVVLDDRPARVWRNSTALLERALGDTGELCGSTLDLEAHSILRLAEPRTTGRSRMPEWGKAMAARRHQTPVVRCKRYSISSQQARRSRKGGRGYVRRCSRSPCDPASPGSPSSGTHSNKNQ